MQEHQLLNDGAVKDLAVDLVLGMAALAKLFESHKEILAIRSENQWLAQAVSLLQKGNQVQSYGLWKDNYDKLCKLVSFSCTVESDECTWETFKRERQTLRAFLDGHGQGLLRLLGERCRGEPGD